MYSVYCSPCVTMSQFSTISWAPGVQLPLAAQRQEVLPLWVGTNLGNFTFFGQGFHKYWLLLKKSKTIATEYKVCISTTTWHQTTQLQNHKAPRVSFTGLLYIAWVFQKTRVNLMRTLKCHVVIVLNKFLATWHHLLKSTEQEACKWLLGCQRTMLLYMYIKHIPIIGCADELWSDVQYKTFLLVYTVVGVILYDDDTCILLQNLNWMFEWEKFCSEFCPWNFEEDNKISNRIKQKNIELWNKFW